MVLVEHLKIMTPMMNKMVSKEEFDNSDRQTKNDFTASTTTLLINKYGCSRSDIEWYEFTSAATFVPYGSSLAYISAPIDVILVYKRKHLRYIELKGRRYASTKEFFKEEGSMCNKEKIENFERIVNGKIKFDYFKTDEYGNEILDWRGKPIYDYSVIYDIPVGKGCWGELYLDKVVRTWWDLEKIGFDNLKPTNDEKMIKGIQIDPDSEKKPQKRGYLHISDAMEYNRITG